MRQILLGVLILGLTACRSVDDGFVRLFAPRKVSAIQIVQRTTHFGSGGRTFSLGAALKREGAEYVCDASKTTGVLLFSDLAPSTSSLSPEAVDKALQLLAAAPVKKEVYQPHIAMTDYYPYARIALTLPDGEILFESWSQGDTRVPWGVIIDGGQYVSSSEDIAEAMRLLMTDNHCLFRRRMG